MIPSLSSESGDFHIRSVTRKGISTYIKIKGKKDMTRKCSACYQFIIPDLFPLKGTKSAKGYSYLHQSCKVCHNRKMKELHYISKFAPTPPGKCECCNQKKGKLTHDHDHKTLTFRGFLCKTCNVGLGNLEDTLEGVLRAAVYLEKDKSKIIEVLNGIKNE